MKSHQDRANALISQANELHRQKKYEQAIAGYRRAIELIPAYGSLNLVIGDMLFEMKQHAEAAEAYRTTLEFVPDHDQAWGSLGQCLMMTGEQTEAAEALDKAVTLNPEDGLSLYYGAMVHTLLEDAAKARTYLQRALALHPDWIDRTREDPLLIAYFGENGKLSNGKKWWQFWK